MFRARVTISNAPMYRRMKRCPRSLPFLKGLVLYSAIPRRTSTAHRPHTQYKAKYRAESPGAGSSVAHRNTAVTKRAKDVDATNSALFARLRRSQASQPTKILVAPRDLAPMKDMVAGAAAITCLIYSKTGGRLESRGSGRRMSGTGTLERWRIRNNG